jgi:hypothetical protein
MPNYVTNYVIIYGKSNNLKKFWKKATSCDNDECDKFHYDNLFPPSIHAHWYDYQFEIWRNNWHCWKIESDISNIDNGLVLLKYNTAWTTSYPFWIRNTIKYKINVTNYFYDECHNYCGYHVFSNGYLVKDKIYNSINEYRDYFKKYKKICYGHLTTESVITKKIISDQVYKTKIKIGKYR